MVETAQKDDIEERLIRRRTEQDDFLASDALDYIRHLKEKIHEILQDNIRDRKRIRKDTAKEILQMWYDECMAHLRPEEAEQVAQTAKDYGVEVDDE